MPGGDNRKGVKGSLGEQVPLDVPGVRSWGLSGWTSSLRGRLWADFKGSCHPSKEFGRGKSGKVLAGSLL